MHVLMRVTGIRRRILLPQPPGGFFFRVAKTKVQRPQIMTEILRHFFLLLLIFELGDRRTTSITGHGAAPAGFEALVFVVSYLTQGRNRVQLIFFLGTLTGVPKLAMYKAYDTSIF